MWQLTIIILGIILAFLLQKLTKDEIKQEKKYFPILEKIILLIILLLFLNTLNFLTILGILLGLIIYKFFKKIYFYLSLICLSSLLISKELFIAIISLIFLFSLINLENSKLKNLLQNIIIFILPLTFLFIQSFINSKIEIFIGIGIAGIIQRARGSAW